MARKLREVIDALGPIGVVVAIAVFLALGIMTGRLLTVSPDSPFSGGFDPQYLNEPETPEMRWLRWAKTIEVRVGRLERGHDEHHANPPPVPNPAAASNEPEAEAEHEHQDE